MLLWLLGTAMAQECAEPFTNDDIAQIVSASTAALDIDDVATHIRLYREFGQRVACLETPVSTESWASLLVAEALVQNVTGGLWRKAMARALQILPTVAGVPSHLRADLGEAAPPPTRAGELPAGYRVWVDGRAHAMTPLLDGLHLVQLTDPTGAWKTAIIDGPFPSDWLPAAEPTAPDAHRPGASWLAIEALAGGGLANQHISGETGTWLTNAEDGGWVAGATTHGQVLFAGPVGVFWDVAVPLHGADELAGAAALFVPFDAFGGAALRVGGASLRAGVGAVSVRLSEAGTARSTAVVQPHLGAALAIPWRQTPLMLDVGLGATAAALHATGRAAVVFPVGDQLGLRVGPQFSLVTAWFAEGEPGDRTATMTRIRGVLSIGLHWGR